MKKTDAKKKSYKLAPLARLSKKTRLGLLAVFVLVASIAALTVFADTPKAGDTCLPSATAPDGFTCQCPQNSVAPCVLQPSSTMSASKAGDTCNPSDTNPDGFSCQCPQSSVSPCVLVATQSAGNTSANCSKPSFFFIPPWYEYLNLKSDDLGQCVPDFHFPDDIWAVVLAVIDMLLRLAGFIAIISIIIAGVQFVFSGGTPEKAANARWRIYNSLIGLAIVAFATAAVTFIGKKFIQ